MPLIDEYRNFLDAIGELNAPNIDQVEVSIARQMYRMAQPAHPELEVGHVEDMIMSVPDGEVTLRVYTPQESGPFPLIVMLHGGGWVIGDLDTADLQSRKVCLGTGAVVVSVDYPLAPEHKFPIAVNDCYAALEFAHSNARQFNADKERIAIAGDSAGGNLAAVVALKARDENGPPLRFQLLVYPVTDGSSFDTTSYHDNAEGFMLTAQTMYWFWDQYAIKADRLNPLASPLLAKNLKNLPPAMIMTAEFDPLRDEGEAYGKRLKESGVPCETVRYDGLIHGFFADGLNIPSTEKAMTDACQALKNALR